MNPCLLRTIVVESPVKKKYRYPESILGLSIYMSRDKWQCKKEKKLWKSSSKKSNWTFPWLILGLVIWHLSYVILYWWDLISEIVIFLPSVLIKFLFIHHLGNHSRQKRECWEMRSQISFLQSEENIMTLPCICVCVHVCDCVCAWTDKIRRTNVLRLCLFLCLIILDVLHRQTLLGGDSAVSPPRNGHNHTSFKDDVETSTL